MEQVFDMSRIASDHIGGKFFDSRGNGVGASLDHGFAPADRAVIGGGFKEKPAGCDFEQFQRYDFHFAILSASRLTSRVRYSWIVRPAAAA